MTVGPIIVALCTIGLGGFLAYFLFDTMRDRALAKRLPAHHATLDAIVAGYWKAVGARQGLVLRTYTHANPLRFSAEAILGEQLTHNFQGVHAMLASLEGQPTTPPAPHEPLAAVETLLDFKGEGRFLARIAAPTDPIASEPLPIHHLHQDALRRLLEAATPTIWGRRLPLPQSARSAVFDRGSPSTHQVLEYIAEMERLLPASIPLASLPLDTPIFPN